MNHSPATIFSKKKGFTLLELIIVIIIVAILATVGLTTYTNQIEASRLAEAKGSIGAMRKLAIEYYLKNGTLVDVNTVISTSCTSDHYFRYAAWSQAVSSCTLVAVRCTASGKAPDAAEAYVIRCGFTPSDPASSCNCRLSDTVTPCPWASKAW